MHSAAFQGVDSTGHRQIGLARARRADAKCDVVLRDVVQINPLCRVACTHIVSAGGQTCSAISTGGQVLVARQHELHLFFGDGFGRAFVQGLQYFQGTLSLGFVTVDFEFLVAVCNLHFQTKFDGAQMLVQSTAQMAQARVVGRTELVAEYQEAGPYCISPLPNDQFSLATSTKLMNTSCWRMPSSLDRSSAMRL